MLKEKNDDILPNVFEKNYKHQIVLHIPMNDEPFAEINMFYYVNKHVAAVVFVVCRSFPLLVLIF